MSSVLIACLLALLWASSRLGEVEAKLRHKIDLDGRSYALSADVSVVNSGEVSDHYTTEEFHSAWQRRSRVNYRIEGPLSGHLSERGTIYSAERQLFLVDREKQATTTCRRVDLEAVNQALNVDFVKLREPMSHHIIGTARLLLYIEENSDKFQAKVVGTRKFEQDIVSTSHYEAHLENGGLTINVLYEESSAMSLALGVPSRVLVEKAHEFTIMFKFTRVVLLKEGELIYSGSSLPSLRHAYMTSTGGSGPDFGGPSSSDLLFDMLAVERAVGCSSDSATNKDFVGLLADSMRYRFSFRARLESNFLSGASEMTVGYEPALCTLRVDRHYQRHSRTLVSFRHDRVYHTYRRRASQRDHLLDQILKVTQDDALDNDVICVVTKASASRSLKESRINQYSLGEMLYGATEVTYLGLARVRGIEAYTFEASASRMPIWMDQPTAYRPGDASEDYKLRLASLKEGSNQSSPSGISYTTVFYVSSRPESNEPPSSMIKDNKLLFMEIFKRARSGQLINWYTISVFDFTWQIKPTAPNGQRTEDFYSLGDECLASATEDNHYARINLKLVAASGRVEKKGQIDKAVGSGEVENGWLKSPVVRNLAFMSGFSLQFGMPPTLAYDVESRISTRGNGGEIVDTISITMLAAEHSESPVDLVYLGNGMLKEETRNQAIVFGSFSFQICYLVAAHSRKNTLLAWDELFSRCYMFHRERADSRPEAVLDMTHLPKPGLMEVYRVVPRSDRKLAPGNNYITKFDDLHEEIVRRGNMLLFDPAAEVNGHYHEAGRLAYFGVRELEVLNLNERIAYNLENCEHINDINKFPGLGLVASDVERNKLIEPKQLMALNETNPVQLLGVTMTFEVCQAACRIDLECRSFSTCIIEGKLQCVLSSVDFRASTLVLQLMLLQTRTYKLGAISSVSLEQALADAGAPEPGAIVHVRRYPTCELHNKLYTDLFIDDGRIHSVNLQDRLLSPVTHPEQCAQKCYEITLASMRDELARFNARKEKPEDWARGYAQTHCEGYFYLPHELIERKQIEITPEQLDGKNVDAATRGYCLLERGLSKFHKANTTAGGSGGGGESDKLKSQVHDLRQSNLDFSVFYEKTHGVSLVETPKTSDESRAYNQVNYLQKLEPELLEVVTGFMARGGNTGSSMLINNAAGCARLCFTQLTTLWPACRSFEYILVTDKSTWSKSAYCAFNTASLWEARATGRPLIVRENSQEQERVRRPAGEQEVQVWHYEPRDMLVAASLAEAFQVTLDEATGERSLATSAVLHFSSMGMFWLVCVVLVAGLVAGARLGYGSQLYIGELLRRGARLLNSSSRLNDDKENLVENGSHIKIENIIVSNGDRAGAREKVPHENGGTTFSDN